MKVMFLVHSLRLAGAERQLAVLATGVAQRGHRVSLACFYGGPLERELRERGIPVYRVKSGRGMRGLGSFLFRLLRLIRRERPEILHSYTESPNVVAVLLKSFLPGVQIVFGVRMADLPATDFSYLELIFQFLCPKLARFADWTIVNSRKGYSVCIRSGYPSERTSIVCNGIDVDRFRPDRAARQRFREELGLADEDVLVGRVGRLHGVKDYRTFLKAGAIVCKNFSKAKLVCVGSGTAGYRQRLIDFADELRIQERVTFLPEREDIVAVYNGLDLLVSSSTAEGFPNVIAEAMSCGVPCVSTDTGDAGLIIGDKSRIVPVADSTALAHAIERSLSNRTEGDDARVRARICENFSIERLVASTEEVLLRLRSEALQIAPSSHSTAEGPRPAA